jgi:transposase
LSTYQQVWNLHRQGWSAQAIARQVGIGKTSVFRYLRTPNFPERQGRSDRGRSVLTPYKEYVLKRWNEGCYNTKRLFEDIQRRGYFGSYDTVARYTRRLRQAQGLKLRQRLVSQPLPKVAEPEKRPLTVRRAAWLVLQRQELQKSDDEQLIIRLKAQHLDLSTAIELAQSFAQMVRQRLPEQLDPWLEQAVHSGLEPFRRFAQRLREDYDAVKAGVTLPVSNGPVEGHINRLKMLKRQMYGRAGIELLSRRFLLAS